MKTLSLIFIFSFFFLCANSQDRATIKLHGAVLYAGIEVGSKGIKMSILEMSSVGAKNGNYKIVKDTSVNTDFISFNSETFHKTHKGLTSLYNSALHSYHIPNTRIFTLFSSGVKVVADRENKSQWLLNLADSFRSSIKEPQREMNAISVLDEARLSHLGIVPISKRYTTFLIDIGSGNTKGGYFPSGNTTDFKLFQITWGTKSISNATEKRTEDDKSISNYYRQMQRVLAGQADEEITYAVNYSGAYNMSDNIAFSGGIVWATATMLYPELIDNPVVPVTYEEVAKLNQRIFSQYKSLTDSALIRLINDKTVSHESVKIELAKINKVFDQRALLSGTGLLLKIMRQFTGVTEQKKFYLVKNGQVGWISAYVKQLLYP